MNHAARVEATRQLVLDGVLTARSTFTLAPLDVVADVVNGCGAAGAKFDFVPDSIYGLKIAPACHVHDWDYFEGVTLAEKTDADAQFLRNLLALVERDRGISATLLRPLRRRRALLYYEMVVEFGAAAYWRGKVPK